MEFVLIRAGTFLMGSPPGEAKRDASEQLHPVTLSTPFYLQVAEVTLGQWEKVMGRSWLFRRQGCPETPVTRVSWRDTQEFLEALNRLGEGVYRLPTEAEWEYAARAGTTTAYPWGEQPDCARAMFGNNENKEETCVDYVRTRGWEVGCPAPVRSYPPNNWGLYDMHGNVWEWVADWFGEYPQGPVTDPKGSAEGSMRVRRGGSWFMYGFYCRSANRAKGHPDSRLQSTGFRVVMEAPNR
jgi:formylglycine-generating enzyme required for sulfatase activity